MTLHLKTQADAELTLLVGDLHFGDPKAAKKRGFKHIEEHDQFVFETLRGAVSDHTDLIVVGDLAPASGLESALTWIAGLPGRKHLILGNIDPGHPCQPSGHEELWKYNSVFSSVQLHLGVLYDGVAAVEATETQIHSSEAPVLQPGMLPVGFCGSLLRSSLHRHYGKRLWTGRRSSSARSRPSVAPCGLTDVLTGSRASRDHADRDRHLPHSRGRDRRGC